LIQNFELALRHTRTFGTHGQSKQLSYEPFSNLQLQSIRAIAHKKLKQ